MKFHCKFDIVTNKDFDFFQLSEMTEHGNFYHSVIGAEIHFSQ